MSSVATVGSTGWSFEIEPPPFAMIAGGLIGVQTGLKAPAAVSVMISPLGRERTPPDGRLNIEQPRRLGMTKGPVGSGGAVVMDAISTGVSRRPTAVGTRRGNPSACF